MVVDSLGRRDSRSKRQPVLGRLASWVDAEMQRAAIMQRIAGLSPSDDDAVPMTMQRELDLTSPRE